MYILFIYDWMTFSLVLISETNNQMLIWKDLEFGIRSHRLKVSYTLLLIQDSAIYRSKERPTEVLNLTRREIAFENSTQRDFSEFEHVKKVLSRTRNEDLNSDVDRAIRRADEGQRRGSGRLRGRKRGGKRREGWKKGVKEGGGRSGESNANQSGAMMEEVMKEVQGELYTMYQLWGRSSGWHFSWYCNPYLHTN